MINNPKKMRREFIRILALLVCLLLVFEQSGFAQVVGQLDFAGHISGLHNSFTQDKFRPLHLRYLSYDNINNNFELLLDKGDAKEFKAGVIEDTTKELLSYFFVGITLPNNSFWVNLRPDFPDNIIDPALAMTDVGKILLEADLQLKKDTAKFTSPETPEGKKYWDKLYQKADELFGTSNVTIPTLTRPWIVPGEIIIRETENNAYIYKATLKVCLEEDYLKDSSTYNFKDERLKQLNEYSSQLIRELIIPKLTKEVNNAKRYAPLRQIYYSLILAQWFKQKFYGKGGLYSWLIDKQNLNGLTSKTPWSKTTYFKEYQKSFKDGEYNIQEPVSSIFGKGIRTYFSGGISFLSESIKLAIIPLPNSNPQGSLSFYPHNIPIEVKGGIVENPPEIKINLTNADRIRSILLDVAKNGLRSQAPEALPHQTSLKHFLIGNIVNPTLVWEYGQDEKGIKVLTIRVKETNKILQTYREDGIIKPQDNDLIQSFLLGKIRDNLLYADATSILSVMAKRPWDYIYSYDLSDIEKRVKNTILFVTDLDKVKIKDKVRIENTDIPPHILESLWKSCYGPLEKVTTGLSLEEIDYILIPQRLKDMAIDCFSYYKNKMIFVDMRKTRLSYRKYYEVEIELPDYESAIEKIKEQNPERQFWAHGLRLPTPDDELLKKGYEENLKEERKWQGLINEMGKRNKADSSKIVDKNVSPNLGESSEINPMASETKKELGGVDFRTMSIITQLMGVSGIDTINTVSSSKVSDILFSDVKSIDRGDPDRDWQEIQNMLNVGIVPSSQRIKDYLRSCFKKEDFGQALGKVRMSILDILRLEEEQGSQIQPEIKELFFLLN